MINSTIQTGEVIFYKLLPKDKPVLPDKLWTGKVMRCYGRDYLLVELLDPGYDTLGLREIITISQIFKVGEGK